MHLPFGNGVTTDDGYGYQNNRVLHINPPSPVERLDNKAELPLKFSQTNKGSTKLLLLKKTRNHIMLLLKYLTYVGNIIECTQSFDYCGMGLVLTQIFLRHGYSY